MDGEEAAADTTTNMLQDGNIILNHQFDPRAPLTFQNSATPPLLNLQPGDHSTLDREQELTPA